MTPDTRGLQDQPDPPALAASVVGAVRTENAVTMDVDLAAIRYRVEDGAHYVDCDRFEVYDYGCRQGRCDCNAAEDLPALLALVDELTAQRDLARDAAVALEQENAQRGHDEVAVNRQDLALFLGEANVAFGRLSARGVPYTQLQDNLRNRLLAALAASSPAAVLGLGLQPETSEQ